MASNIPNRFHDCPVGHIAHPHQEKDFIRPSIYDALHMSDGVFHVAVGVKLRKLSASIIGYNRVWNDFDFSNRAGGRPFPAVVEGGRAPVMSLLPDQMQRA